ncbi:MAG: hypothetical protein L6R38_000426 [Xanthoria sp. 2 TBL-2021]|nr:MAG: hypothetical protein L6R38_000426 [Xanthoria sp. 2 TBL-2021]
MASDSGTGPPRPGLSLYANLLEPTGSGSAAPGTISRAPVVFKQAVDGAKVQDSDASALRQQASVAPLLFRPTKRPQVSTQRSKPKSNPLKSGLPNSGTENSKSSSGGELNSTSQPPVKSTLSDWAAAIEDDDMGGFHAAEKRQRGGRKKRKKNNETRIVQNWDDIYDPSRPNSYEEYQNSEEKVQEIREWKDRLYAHRISQRRSKSKDTSSDDGQPIRRNHPNISHGLFFAPPADFENTTSTVQVLDDATGDDAYLRRLKLSDTHQKSALDSAQHEAEPTRPHPASFQPIAQSTSDPPIRRNMQSTDPSISRAPVRYNLPPPPPEIPSTEAELADALGNEDSEPDESKNGEAPRSLRPGQKGFAERLMSKYGWTKGSGLGASGSGIVNPLRVQVEKQKKKPDAEGGGFVRPGGRGKIIGGKKGASDSEAQQGPFGAMSEVIVLHGMIDGLDLDAELERADDGGLLQEIGEECGEKYGRVERVFIDRNDSNSPRVFVNFTSQLSALRAVNALNGRIFNGNAIRAMFYNQEKFDLGIYDLV